MAHNHRFHSNGEWTKKTHRQKTERGGNDEVESRFQSIDMTELKIGSEQNQTKENKPLDAVECVKLIRSDDDVSNNDSRLAHTHDDIRFLPKKKWNKIIWFWNKSTVDTPHIWWRHTYSKYTHRSPNHMLKLFASAQARLSRTNSSCFAFIVMCLLLSLVCHVRVRLNVRVNSFFGDSDFSIS